MQGIYSWTNKINKKVYIGQSTNLDSRKRDHVYAFKKGSSKNKHLRSSVKKYGINNFVYEIIIEGPFNKEVLTELEQFYMNKYEAEGKILYNKIPASLPTTGMKGHKHSEEAKRKISEAGKGRHHSLETRQKQSENQKGNNNSFFGKKHTPKTLKKISEHSSGSNNPNFGKQAALGYKHTPEELKKMSETSKGNKNWLGKSHSEETKQKMALSRKRYWDLKKAASKTL
jgi:group I intron endonuclease